MSKKSINNKLTKLPLVDSKDKESILKKIASYEAKIKLLSKVRKFGVLSAEEKLEAKNIMRELNLRACLQHDLSEAIAIFSEKCAVYSKKLEVSQRRKEYRQHNQSFELYSNNFYRQLGCAKKIDHRV